MTAAAVILAAAVSAAPPGSSSSTDPASMPADPEGETQATRVRPGVSASRPAGRAAGTALVEDEGPVRVTCEGPLEWKASAEGSNTLSLSGGVLVTRGELTLRARRAEAVFPSRSRGAGPDASGPGGRGDPPGGGDALEFVSAEGDVRLDSPSFSVRADVASITARAVEPPAGLEAPGASDGGEGKAPPGRPYEIRLERRERDAVVLSSGRVRMACKGPVVYETSRARAILTGGVTATATGGPEARISAPVGGTGEVGATEGEGKGAGVAQGPASLRRAQDGGAELVEGAAERASAPRGGSAGGAFARTFAGRPFTARMSCDEARVHFRRERLTAGKAAGNAPPVLPPIERAELVGNVVVVVDEAGGEKEAPGEKEASGGKEASVWKGAPGGGGRPRRIRAALATYDAARETVVFSSGRGGEPPPEVEFRGVLLTAPEIILYLPENRVESSGGKMRATVGPRGR